MIIQTNINSLGTDTVAAWAAYSKIDRVCSGVRTCKGMTICSALFLTFFIIYYLFFGKLKRKRVA